MIVTVGASVRAMRGELRWSQQVLAARSNLSPNTVAGLEQGRGTIASLVAVLRATSYRLAHHYDPAMSLGQHVAGRRRKLKLSLNRLAMLTALSKPTLIGVEDGHGRISAKAHLPLAGLTSGDSNTHLQICDIPWLHAWDHIVACSVSVSNYVDRRWSP